MTSDDARYRCPVDGCAWNQRETKRNVQLHIRANHPVDGYSTGWHYVGETLVDSRGRPVWTREPVLVLT